VAHTWSLSVEEQFYLLWPLVLAIALRRDRATVALLTALAIAFTGVALWRVYLLTQGASLERLYNGLDTRSDGLVLGCFIGIVLPFVPVPIMSWIARLVLVPATLMAVALFMVPWDEPALYMGGYTLTALCCGWLLLAAMPANGQFAKLMSRPVLRWVGKRSYSLYLWHYPVILLLLNTSLDRFWVGVLSSIVSLLLADASYRFIERPFLQLKTRIAEPQIAHASVS